MNNHPVSETTNQINELKRQIGKDNIRPLVSKFTGKISFEACAGSEIDPRSGKYSKIRQSFGADKFGSAQAALKAAQDWIGQMKYTIRQERGAIFSIPLPYRNRLSVLIERAEADGLDLIEVLERSMELIKKEKVSHAVTFEQAAKECRAQKERENLSRPYLRDLRDIYRLFGQDFDTRKLHQIEAGEVEEWLDDRDIGPVTWNNYRRMLGVLWSFALEPRRGWAKTNVILEIKEREVKEEEVTALSVQQAKTLLATASDKLPQLIPYLCLGMFAGLRRSEAQAVRWEDIDWEAKAIRVTGGKMRSATSRYVDLGEAFIDWMKPLAQAEGLLCDGVHKRRADLKILRTLTFDFDGNIFRHSYGSYHHAYHKNAALTAAEMGHESVKMLMKRYRKPYPKELAAKYWALNRQLVLKGEDQPQDSPQ
jgi:integrase